jgi:asparagine synthase (glutamine-hydrolysing)
MPWELPELVGDDLAREGLARLDPINHIRRMLVPDPVEPFARVATLEASLYMRNQLLRDTDWASMAHSLEVRVPLVDAVLLAKVAGMGLGRNQPSSKALLAEAPKRALPGKNRRSKTGFVVPIAKWIEKQQQSLISEWKRVPLLRSPQCHWSRRWAYSIAQAA